MALEASTKDCTSLGDAELAEMADLSTAGQGLEAGLLSKQAEEWVLVTQVFDGTKLRGFVFSTLGAHRWHAISCYRCGVRRPK